MICFLRIAQTPFGVCSSYAKADVDELANFHSKRRLGVVVKSAKHARTSFDVPRLRLERLCLRCCPIFFNLSYVPCLSTWFHHCWFGKCVACFAPYDEAIGDVLRCTCKATLINDADLMKKYFLFSKKNAILAPTVGLGRGLQ